MSEKEIIRVLELAEMGKLPDRIEDDSIVQIAIVKELYDDSFLEAIDASSNDGLGYLEARINVNGREYLKALKQQHFEASPQGKAQRVGVRILDWIGGIVTGLIIAWVTFKYFK